MAGRKILITLKRKTATLSHGKKTVSETENELVVRIPLIVRFRPIVVQPQTVIIVFQLEDVGIAVGVGLVRPAFRNTADLSVQKSTRGRAVLYL